jgi:monoamine oxidase
MHVLADPSLVALADEVGAERVIPPRAAPSRRVLVRGGVRSVLDAGVMPPDLDPLPGEEAALEGMLAWARALGPSNVTGDPSEADWIDAARASLDGLSLEAAVQREGASAALARAMARDLGMGASASELSALWIAQQAASIGVELTWANAAGRLRGGTDRFPEAVAARLGERVVRGAIVREILASAEGVRVRFERAGSNEEIAAERVVVAVHAPVVREFRFEPGLIAQAHLALDALRTASVVRAWAELDRLVWQDEGVEGTAYSDGPFGDLRALVDLGSPQVVGTYVSGEGARVLAALAPEERTRQLVEHVCTVHPAARDHVRGTYVHAWDEDPYARGAYVWMPVGVLTGALPAFEAPMPPSHRVHFAGDWCSHRPGFMHGAFASAGRVLAEIERAG